MSWEDRYIRNLRITTGDQEVFEVFTRPGHVMEAEWNGMDYSFVEIEGPLIKKKNLKGRTFPLEFYFVGADNVEEARSFHFSASHPDPWVIEHPYYDNILVQVLSIKYDSSELNVTKVTCIARETITDVGTLVMRSDPRDTVILQKGSLDEVMSTVDPEIVPTITDTGSVINTAQSNYKEGIKIIGVVEDAENYFNKFNTALAYVNTFTATPILAMQSLINFIKAPALFVASVRDRLTVLRNQFDNLRRTLLGLTTVPQKKLYQAQGVASVAAICEAVVNPTSTDYKNPTVAITIASDIKTIHAQFLADLDTLQSVNGGSPENFVPDFELIQKLNDVVLQTVSSLFEIALAGRREYSFTLPENSNAILLTYQFYSLDLDDNNLLEFIENNELTYKEIALGVKKGKTVAYYV